MIDFSKHTKGDTLTGHVCFRCFHFHGVARPEIPWTDNGGCVVCGHRGAGWITQVCIGDWLVVRPRDSKFGDFAKGGYTELDEWVTRRM